MSDQDDAPQEYLEGFNKGYTLAEHYPELAQKLLSATGKSLQLDGMKQGIERFDREKDKDNLPAWMQKDQDKPQEKDLDKEQDKTDVDLDRE